MRRNAYTLASPILLATLLAACDKPNPPATPPKAPTPPPPPVATVDAAPQAPAFVEVPGMKTPESVLVMGDVYLVSNINGGPGDKDDNGFISKVSPDGKVLEATWIDGAKPDVTLNAPKGMAVRNGILYVSDIDTVRKFDVATGAPKGEVKLKGISFANDVAVGGDTIYVTDTGVDASFKPTGTDAVWTIDAKDKATKVLAAKDLGGPNGVTVVDGKVWVNVFGGKTLFRLDGKKKADAQELPAGQGDGLEALGDGRLASSSWETSTIYAGTPPGAFEPLITDVKSPADFGVDVARKKIIVPLFQGDMLRIYPY